MDGKKIFSWNYDRHCNAEVASFKPPEGLFLPKFPLICTVEILKIALRYTIRSCVFF